MSAFPLRGFGQRPTRPGRRLLIDLGGKDDYLSLAGNGGDWVRLPCRGYNNLYVGGIDEIRLRLRISKLEAQLALREIESDTLHRGITSPLTSEERKDEAQKSLDAARGDCANLLTELDTLRHADPDIGR